MIAVPARGNTSFQITVDASAAPSGTHFAAVTLRRLFLGRFPTGDPLRLPVAIRKP
jgi:hypothetical protein